MMLTKLSTFAAHTPAGDPLVIPFRQGSSVRKLAGRMMPEVQDWLSTYRSDREHIPLLVNALGASEYWGLNSNGDWFGWQAISHECSARCAANHSFDSFTGRPPGPYGYLTFLAAHPFLHHRNKDPDRALGRVVLACLNPKMRRAELVVLLSRKLAAQHDGSNVVDRVDRGECPDTSMGARVPYDVCFPAGTLVRTRTGHRPIDELKVGDHVWTHGRNWQPIVATSQRTERLLEIKASGLPPTTPSPEHPYYILRRDSVRACHGSANGQRLRHQPTSEGVCKRCSKEITWTPEWVAAEDIRPGDYLLSPIDSSSEGKSSVGAARARLLGFFVGDGHIIRQRKGRDKTGEYHDVAFGITVGSKLETKLARVVNAAVEAGVVNAPKVYAQKGRNADQVVVFDQVMVAWLREHGGRGSRGKRLSSNVFEWTRSEKLEFLGAYIDTDGCFDSNGATRISTVNRGLALDTQKLCHSVGLPASVVSAGSRVAGFSGKATQVWNVFLPPASSSLLSEYAQKVSPVDATPSSQSFFWKQFWCTPVTSVQDLEREDTVYNIQVAGDESYTVEGAAVHNCLICGHKSKTRDDYCRHVKELGMGTVLPDGRIVGVDNLHPRFFDISFVFIGADPTSKVMAKLASHEGAPPSVIAAEEYYGLRKGQDGLQKVAAVETESVKPLATPPPRDNDPGAGQSRWNGLTINVENPKGTWRVGKGWSTLMKADYGEIDGSTGADGDPVDVYVGSAKETKDVYVIHQNHVSGPKAGQYDEDKVMLGYSSPEAAKKAYLDHYVSEKFFRSMTTMPLDTFKKMVMSGEVEGEKIAMSRDQKRMLRVAALVGSAAFSGQQVDKQHKKRKKKKLASITKRISPPRALGTVAKHLADSEGNIDPATLDNLVDRADLPTALHGLASSGIGLKPAEFQRIVLRSMGSPELSDSLDRDGVLFPAPPKSCSCHEPLSLTDKSDQLTDLLGKLVSGRSYFPPVLVRRRIVIVSRPHGVHKIDHTPLLMKMADAYGGYRDELLKTAGRSVLLFTRRNPELMARICGSGDVDLFGDEGQRVDARSSAIPLALLLASLRHPEEDEADDRALMVRVRSLVPELPESHNPSSLMLDPFFAQLMRLLSFA